MQFDIKPSTINVYLDYYDPIDHITPITHHSTSLELIFPFFHVCLQEYNIKGSLCYLRKVLSDRTFSLPCTPLTVGISAENCRRVSSFRTRFGRLLG